MHSLIYSDILKAEDIVIQISRCSFDIHVEDIMGTLIAGGTLVMLRPRGTIDFDYLFSILKHKQITYMHTVPSLLYSFFTFLQQTNNVDAVKYLKTLCSSGMYPMKELVFVC